MRSIAVAKQDMGVLPRERLLLSPFGALAQAFAEEMLSRAEQTEGPWPFLPLELLEEGGEGIPSTALPPVTLQVDLRLVLEALRRENGQAERNQATQRIVERILQIQSQREQPPQSKGWAPSAPRSLTVLGTVHQSFRQNLIQNIHIAPFASPGTALRKAASQGAPAQLPGALPWQPKPLEKEKRICRWGAEGLQNHAPVLRREIAAAHPETQDVLLAERTALPLQPLAFLQALGDRAAGALDIRTAARSPAMSRLQSGMAEHAVNGWLRQPTTGRAAPGVVESLRQTQRPQAEFPPEVRRMVLTGGLPPGPGRQPDGRGQEGHARLSLERWEVFPRLPQEQFLRGEPGSWREPPDSSGSQHRKPVFAPEGRETSPRLPPEQFLRGEPGSWREPPDLPGVQHRKPAFAPEGRETSLRPPPEQFLRGEPGSWREPPDLSGAQHRKPVSAPEGRATRRGSAARPEKGQGEQPLRQQDLRIKDVSHREAPPYAALPGAEGMPPVARALRLSARDIRMGAANPSASTPASGQKTAEGAAQSLPSWERAEPISQPRPSPALQEKPSRSPAPLELALSAGAGGAGTTPGVPGTQHLEAVFAPAGQDQKRRGEERPPLEKLFSREATLSGADLSYPLPARESGGAPPAVNPLSAVPLLSAAIRDIRMSREDIHSGAEALEQRRQSSFVPGLQEQMASAAVRRRGREDAMRALLPGEMAWNQPDNWKNLLVPTDIPPLYAGDSALSHHFADGAGAAPQPPHGERGAILPSREFREAAQPVPLALAYGRAGPTEAARAPRQTGSPAQPQSPESEYVRSLPDWAQRFLRSSSAGTPAMGVAKDISSLPQPDHAVTWTAPDYRPPQAAIAYREKGGGGSPQTRQEVRVSDAEIQRTADRVYRMIEERIRRERRRLGF